MSGARNVASIAGIFGASGSGKSTLIKLELVAEDPPRLAIWDPKREYKAFGQSFDKLAELRRAMRRGRAPFRVVFHPALSRKKMREQFDVFCSSVNEAANAWIVVDELADVTEPGWAPEGWEVVTRQGRHAGLVVRGASQRPAEVDKSFLGNCTDLAVFRLNAEGDIDRMAKLLGIDRASVAALPPLSYLFRNMRTGKVTAIPRIITARDLKRLP